MINEKILGSNGVTPIIGAMANLKTTKQDKISIAEDCVGALNLENNVLSASFCTSSEVTKMLQELGYLEK